MSRAPSAELFAPCTPPLRQRPLNDHPIDPEGRYVLYWMIAQRRLSHNFALQLATEQAAALDVPLLIFEPLRIAYPWASDRLHRFVIDGMRDHAAQLAGQNTLYYPYVEPEHDADKGLLASLAEHAALIVTDDYPCFFIPSMLEAAAKKIPRHMIAVDANGILPLRATDRVFTTAYSFRRALHKILPPHLSALSLPHPLATHTPRKADEETLSILSKIKKKWPEASEELLTDRSPEQLAPFDIDHQIPIVEDFQGGDVAAEARLTLFLDELLAHYPDDRNAPSKDGSSRLSPYLHFGHLGADAIFAQLCKKEGWSPGDQAQKPTGKREGWWKMSDAAEAFLDELLTWRELGYNMTAHAPATYSTYDSLPEFAKETLDDHRDDPREHLYSLEELAAAKTHDRVWNAAQNELLQTGRIHNYMRMLWGKKILEWTPSPEDALEVMIELNNRYALDGRDPNSYSGIFWTLGRYDRGWAERPIFGKIRYMSSESAQRKFDLDPYLDTFAPREGSQGKPKKKSAKKGA